MQVLGAPDMFAGWWADSLPDGGDFAMLLDDQDGVAQDVDTALLAAALQQMPAGLPLKLEAPDAAQQQQVDQQEVPRSTHSGSRRTSSGAAATTATAAPPRPKNTKRCKSEAQRQAHKRYRDKKRQNVRALLAACRRAGRRMHAAAHRRRLRRPASARRIHSRRTRAPLLPCTAPPRSCWPWRRRLRPSWRSWRR